MSDASSETPVASGSLGETPFGHLMLYLYRRQQSGTLVVTDPAGVEIRVRIHQGRAIMAQLPDKAADILGALAPLCALSGGSFAFYDAAMLDSPTVAGQLDPYALMGASLAKGHVRDDMVDSVIGRFEQTPMRLQSGSELKRLGLLHDVTPLMELIRAAPAPIGELIAQSPLPRDKTRRVLYVLIATHMLAPYADSTGAGEPARAHDTDTGAAERTRQLRARPHSGAVPGVSAVSRQMSLRPPGGQTSVRPPGGQTSVRPPGGQTSVRPPGGQTSVRPPGAQASMRPPGAQASMRPEGRGRGGDAPKDIPTMLREVEALVARGQHAQALSVLEPMLQKHGDDPPLVSMRAYVLYDSDGRGKQVLPGHVVKAIDQAYKLDHEDPRALLLRGFQRKHEGKLDRAVKLFARASRMDPKNLEAQREARLARMRLAKG